MNYSMNVNGLVIDVDTAERKVRLREDGMDTVVVIETVSQMKMIRRAFTDVIDATKFPEEAK